jgi:3-hydroxyacyl-[acyl-carrier-protein] dehydratase
MTQMEFQFTTGVNSGHPCLDGHFPGNPLVPGALLLAQVCHRIEVATGYGVGWVEQAKFHAPLRPDEVAVVRCTADARQAHFKAHAMRASGATQIASGTLRFTDRPGGGE